MNPLGTRRAAAQLAQLLEGRLADGALRPDVAGAAALAHRLHQAAPALAATPDPDFRAALRTRLVAVASVRAATAAAEGAATAVAGATRSPAALGRRVTRASGVAVGAMASVVAVTGVAAASSAALPGDPFYGLKRAAEGLQLRTADGPQAQGERHLEFAGSRMDEVRALVLGRDAGPAQPSPTTALSAGDAARVREALADLDDEVRSADALLHQAHELTGDSAPLQSLLGFLDRQRSALTALLPDLTGATRTRADASVALLSSSWQQTRTTLLAAPGGGPVAPGTLTPAQPSTRPTPATSPSSRTAASTAPTPGPVRASTPATPPTIAPTAPNTPKTGPSQPGPGLPTRLPVAPLPLDELPLPTLPVLPEGAVPSAVSDLLDGQAPR